MLMRTIRGRLLALVAMAGALACGGAMFAKSKPLSWKGIDDALLRVNDNPVKEWGVFQAGNKRDPLLLQMGNRFLLIRIHDRLIFEIDPGKIRIQPDELHWDPSEHPADPLATSDWDVADTEAVFRVRAKIVNENQLLEIDLPHQLDLSGMSPRSGAASRHR